MKAKLPLDFIEQGRQRLLDCLPNAGVVHHVVAVGKQVPKAHDLMGRCETRGGFGVLVTESPHRLANELEVSFHRLAKTAIQRVGVERFAGGFGDDVPRRILDISQERYRPTRHRAVAGFPRSTG